MKPIPRKVIRNSKKWGLKANTLIGKYELELSIISRWVRGFKPKPCRRGRDIFWYKTINKYSFSAGFKISLTSENDQGI